MNASTGAGNAGAPATPALAGDLKKLVLELMMRRLERMFDGADDFLMTMSERTRNSVEQRRNFEAKTLVRQNRKALTRVFADRLTASFQPGAETRKKPESDEVSFEELSLRKTRTIEESIAVNNIAVKVENQNELPLWEINRRIDWLIHEGKAPISPQALAPSTLCDAFRIGTQSLNLDFQTELLIYKLFDTLVVPHLNEVYGEALKLLDQGGVNSGVLKNSGRAGPPPPKGMAARPKPAPSPAAGGAKPAGAPPDVFQHAATGQYFPNSGMTAEFTRMPAAGPGGMPALDPRTLEALRSARFASSGGSASYSDAELANDLARAASGNMVAGWAAPQARASLQAADLVGKMFNGVLEDPSVPPELKPQLDEMRFSVIKSALADRSFFANPEHPIRKLVGELASMAAGTRTTGPGSIGPLSDLLARIQAQFQVAARNVKEAAATAAPLAEPDVERFLEDQLVQGKARRQALIDKARQVVQEEIQLRMHGRKIPEAARPLLFTGLPPLLGLRLLRRGMDSEGWREATLNLQKVIELLDPAPGVTSDGASLDPLCAQMASDFYEVGMLEQRVGELLAGLRQGYDAAQRERKLAPPAALASPPAAPAAPPPPERPLALLRKLLVPGEWFKVHDAERKETRWLKVSAQHLDDERPEFRGRVAFSEFSGQNTLLVKADDLLDHLATGMTEPFDQSPVARATLADLIKQQKAWMDAAPKAAP